LVTVCIATLPHYILHVRQTFLLPGSGPFSLFNCTKKLPFFLNISVIAGQNQLLAFLQRKVSKQGGMKMNVLYNYSFSSGTLKQEQF